VSIQPISSTTGFSTSTTLGSTVAPTMARHHRLNLQHIGLAAAAEALGMSVGDLRTALLNGASLASLASSKGISTETLAVAIPGALMQADPSLSVARATALAQRMIEGRRTPQSPRDADRLEQEHRGGAAMRAAFSAAAGALGMTRNDLVGALESGHTLGSLAQKAGVSSDTLTTTIKDALVRADSSLTPERAAVIAQQLVQGPPEGRSGHDGDDD